MRVRTICAGLAIAVATILLPALAVSVAAASPGVATTGSGCPGNLGWNNQSPFSATINPGDTVTWSNCAAGYHYLQSTSGGWCLGNQTTSGAVGTPWSYSCRFTSPGRFTFWCGFHTSGMAGTIVVTGTPPPPPPPPPAPNPTHTSVPLPTHSQPPPTPAAAPQSQPTPPPAAPPSPTPEVVALAPSPSPSDAGSPSPSAAPTLAPAPASTTTPGGPIAVILLVAAVATLAGGGFYWYRNRQAI